MDIKYLQQRKKKLEYNINMAVTEELISFRKDTGLSPDYVSVLTAYIRTNDKEKSDLFVKGVTCGIEI